jgi:hypothetical protein
MLTPVSVQNRPMPSAHATYHNNVRSMPRHERTCASQHVHHARPRASGSVGTGARESRLVPSCEQGGEAGAVISPTTATGPCHLMERPISEAVPDVRVLVTLLTLSNVARAK